MDTVIWSREPADRPGTPLLILLHGYGSEEAAMRSLFAQLPAGVSCAAPRGTRDIAGQYGWFLLDYFLSNDFAEVISSASTLLAWIDTVVEEHRFSSVSVLGFSQGMSMATTLLRLRPDAFTVGVGLSGFVLRNELLGALEPLPRRIPFLWARDTQDLVINPEATAYTGDWLRRNTELTENHYPGLGHTVGVDELRDVSAFLTAHVPGAFVARG